MRHRWEWRRTIRCRSTRRASIRVPFVGDVVLKGETPLIRAAASRGCRYLIGTDMLFEQIPAYLEFFGHGPTTPDELRAVAQLSS